MEPGGRRQPVCRSLFGPVDHEQLRRELEQQLRDMSEQDSRRWNFHFQTDKPLPGRFEWEEVPAERAAAFYRGPARGPARPPQQEQEQDGDRLRGCDQENCPRMSNTHKCPAEVTPVRRKRALSKAPARSRNYARITDFFSKRRRMEIRSVQSSEAALCRTIR